MSYEGSPADGESNRAPVVSSATTDFEVTCWSIVRGLRQRRAASHRLEPLRCGHRDVLDCATRRGRANLLAVASCGDLVAESGRHLDLAERDDASRELAEAGWVA